MEQEKSSQDFSPEDIVIPVMGITGSGKSTFISRCTGENVGVGHSLQSQMRKVSHSTINYKDRKVHLIDTPGFDDSNLDDLDILKEFSFWLSMAYARRPPLLLSGIIYLHPITNSRMKGTDKDSLAMFQALCGQKSLSYVVMATTMWNGVKADEGEKRQASSSEVYWKDLVDAGTTVFKHDDIQSSAFSTKRTFKRAN